jgi:hypothetical protein
LKTVRSLSLEVTHSTMINLARAPNFTSQKIG